MTSLGLTSRLLHRLKEHGHLANAKTYIAELSLGISNQDFDGTDEHKDLENLHGQIVEELHSSFMKIVNLGLEAENRALKNAAQTTFLSLALALERHSELYDHRK